jgi:ABC-2 type transport system ATP-binding protein
MTAVLEARHLSKWYGNVLGLSDVSLALEPGITGLLGPNGAGKSTLMKLLTGQMKPNLGQALVRGEKVWNNIPLFREIGFCPEADAFYEEISGWEFLTALVRLHGIGRTEAAARAEKALGFVELLADKDRRIRGYSRGMRQRLKIAQAIAHDPRIIILDEPLSGLDPLGKRKVIRLIRDYGREGRTVLVSSHVLPEIEAMTSRVVLIHQGKIFAEGDIPYIRDLIEKHPHRISVRCDRPRDLAARLIGDECVLNVSFGPEGRSLLLETFKRDVVFGRLPGILTETGIRVEEITSPDDNLQAVFDYLVGK